MERCSHQFNKRQILRFDMWPDHPQQCQICGKMCLPDKRLIKKFSKIACLWLILWHIPCAFLGQKFIKWNFLYTPVNRGLFLMALLLTGGIGGMWFFYLLLVRKKMVYKEVTWHYQKKRCSKNKSSGNCN